MNRRSFLALLAVPLAASGIAGCTDKVEYDEVEPSASVTYSMAEREWLLSSPEQQAAYCSDYGRGDQHMRSVRYYGLGEQDAGEKFVEDFLKLLKEKC